jgi:hypothetical protein
MIDADYDMMNSYSISKAEKINNYYRQKLKGLLNKKHTTTDTQTGELKETFTNKERNAFIKEKEQNVKDGCYDKSQEEIKHKIVLNDLYEYYYDYIKQKYNKSKDIIKSKSDDYECECGAVVKKINKLRHENTDKHKSFIRGTITEKIEKFDCLCGSTQILYIQRKTHEKSAKHQNYINGVIPEKKEPNNHYDCECGLTNILRTNRWKHENSKSHINKLNLLCIQID